MEHAFVSYVRDNAPQVERLAADLRRAGVDVWLDRESLVAGERWAEAIVSAIEAGGFFLPCFSRQYLLRERTYMDEELNVARAVLARRAVDRPWCIPLLLDQTSPAQVGLTSDPALGALQCVAMWPDWADGLRRLLATLSPERAFGPCLNGVPPVTDSPVPVAPLLALDFGTSNSLLAYLDESSKKWVAIKAADGRSFFPSVVTFTEDWHYWVGAEAMDMAHRHPERCVQNIKRVLAQDGEVQIGHKRFDAVTLASLVIRHMKNCAERQLGVPVDAVVTAAPVEHGRRQRTALHEACRQAGLRVKRVIGESTAAGLLAAQWAAASGRTDDALVLVVDIGGGTTDLSLIALFDIEDEWQFEVLETAGEMELGGIDYDTAYYAFLHSRYVAPLIARGLPWSGADDRRLRMLANQVKHMLSDKTSCHAALPNVELRPGEPGVLEMQASRDDVEAAVTPLDRRLLPLFERLDAFAQSHAVWRAREMEREGKLSPYDKRNPLAAVILAGQGAKHWSIASLIRSRYPGAQLLTDYQDSAVVQGLAVQGGVLTGSVKDHLLLDVTNRNIGVLCSSLEQTGEEEYLRFDPRSDSAGQWTVLISRGRMIPTKAGREGVVHGPNPLQIVFGEWSDKPTEVDQLAVVTCTLPSGERRVWIEADIDANGTLRFSVYERTERFQRTVFGQAELSATGTPP